MSSDVLDLEDKRLLNKTIAAREVIIDTLMKDGKVPTDKCGVELLTSTLNGLDSVVIHRAKLRVEDKQAEAQKNAAAMVAEVLRRHSAKRESAIPLANPALPGEFTLVDKVEGEDHIGVQTFTYDEFVAK